MLQSHNPLLSYFLLIYLSRSRERVVKKKFKLLALNAGRGRLERSLIARGSKYSDLYVCMTFI